MNPVINFRVKEAPFVMKFFLEWNPNHVSGTIVLYLLMNVFPFHYKKNIKHFIGTSYIHLGNFVNYKAKRLYHKIAKIWYLNFLKIAIFHNFIRISKFCKASSSNGWNYLPWMIDFVQYWFEIKWINLQKQISKNFLGSKMKYESTYHLHIF